MKIQHIAQEEDEIIQSKLNQENATSYDMPPVQLSAVTPSVSNPSKIVPIDQVPVERTQAKNARESRNKAKRRDHASATQVLGAS